MLRPATWMASGSVVLAELTAKNGEVSRISTYLDEGAGVVTSRGDVHFVVTEHGIADLHGRSLRERARALIAIADPKFREELEQGARCSLALNFGIVCTG